MEVAELTESILKMVWTITVQRKQSTWNGTTRKVLIRREGKTLIMLVVTARVAKRAKVMFLQACVTHSVQLRGGGGRWHTKCNMGLGQNVYPLPPPGTRSECLPPPPPGTRSDSLPPPPLGPGQNVYPPPWDQVRMSTPPGTRSECLPPPWDQVRMSTPSPPLGPGQNVYPPPWDQVRMSTPPSWYQVRMSTPPQTTCRRAVRILLECILVGI